MKKLYRKFFCIPPNAKVPDKVFKARTLLSVLTMIVCSVIFCSITFAWFTNQQSVTIAPVTAAEYSLSIKIDEKPVGTAASQDPVEYTCPSVDNNEHTFAITASGTAATGYCVINAAGKTYSTVQIPKDGKIILTIIAAEGTEIIFSANWGEYSGNEEQYGNEKPIQISDASSQVYTITAPLPITEDPITEETTAPAEGEPTTGEAAGPAESNEAIDGEEPAPPAEDDGAAPDTEKAADPSAPTAPPASPESEESKEPAGSSGIEAEEKEIIP